VQSDQRQMYLIPGHDAAIARDMNCLTAAANYAVSGWHAVFLRALGVQQGAAR